MTETWKGYGRDMGKEKEGIRAVKRAKEGKNEVRG